MPTSSPTVETTPTALPCWGEGGRLEKGQLAATLLPQPLLFRVYLPPCYDQQTDRRYPVLYLLHGQTYNDDQWDRLGVDETADALIAAGEIPPLLIIMPAEQDQYTPPPENPYGQALVEELIPYIERNYRARTDRAHRAIGGLSRGGNWALHLGLTRWELFGAVGAHSTPSFVTDGPPRLREWLDDIPPGQWPRLYLDAGADDGWKEYMLNVEAVLTEKDIPHEWHLNQGAHEEAYWAAHVEEYLRWYTEPW